MNRVEFLLNTPFSSLSREQKLVVVKMGPYQPYDYSYIISDGKQRRSFNTEWFARFPWLTVNTEKNTFHCFNCLTFGVGDKTHDTKWSRDGFTNIKNFIDRANSHGKLAAHLHSTAHLRAFGTSNIKTKTRIDTGNPLSAEEIERHNETVTQHRSILCKVVDAIKFCGFYEISLLPDEDENEASCNNGIFNDLLKLLSTFDNRIYQHVATSSVRKYTSAAIQNELLDCIYDVYIDNVQEMLNDARFVALEVNEIKDVSCKSQFVIILRFVKNNGPVERFLKFVEGHGANVETRPGSGLAKIITDELTPYNLTDKLIAQAYDGATVMNGNTCIVQKLVKEVFPNAHYIHCYSHPTNLILQKLSTNIPEANLFFACLSSFSTFFSPSERVEAFRKACNRSLSQTCETAWNFHSGVINSVVNFKDQILDCLHDIQYSQEWDQTSKHNAVGLCKILEDPTFNYFLQFFKNIFFHTDTLLSQFQNCYTTGVDLESAISDFVCAISQERKNISPYEYEEPNHPGKRRRLNAPHTAASEMCDILISQLANQLMNSSFLQAFSIVNPKRFREFKRNTPTTQIKTLKQNYPEIDPQSLITELEVIYSNKSFQLVETFTCAKLFKYLCELDLKDTFQEVGKLLEILLTTPVHTVEPDMALSTLEKIKSFARNSTPHDKLNALAVLSVHKDAIRNDFDFNHKVIDKFACKKNKRAEFIYKET